MSMVEVQAGLGMGIEGLVWVFEQAALLEQFVNSGWEFGAQATAAAKTGSSGASYQGAVAVQPGVWLYQLTGDGLAAGADREEHEVLQEQGSRLRSIHSTEARPSLGRGLQLRQHLVPARPGSKDFIAAAFAAVSGPRSRSYTCPSWLT